MDIAKYSLLMQLMRKENIIKDVPKYWLKGTEKT